MRSKASRASIYIAAKTSGDGAPKCAGLDLHRYSVEEMTARLGNEFSLLRQERYTYINPHGDPRPYTYALYRRSTAG